jgi:hypothetical protein
MGVISQFWPSTIHKDGKDFMNKVNNLTTKWAPQVVLNYLDEGDKN